MTEFANRVAETTQTTGTGTMDLDGAQTGFRAFSAELTSGDEVYYVIEDDPTNPTEYEFGIGTFTNASPDTLSRDTVHGSSNGDAKISLQGGTTYTVSAVITKESLERIASVLRPEKATIGVTSSTFVNIPSWVKRITLMFVGISTNGVESPRVVIGDSGGLEISGYLGSRAAGNTSANAQTVAFFLTNSTLAADIIHGTMVLTLEDEANNVWTAMGIIGNSNSSQIAMTAGEKSLSGKLTQVRLWIDGIDELDAGAWSIIYE